MQTLPHVRMSGAGADGFVGTRWSNSAVTQVIVLLDRAVTRRTVVALGPGGHDLREGGFPGPDLAFPQGFRWRQLPIGAGPLNGGALKRRWRHGMQDCGSSYSQSDQFLLMTTTPAFSPIWWSSLATLQQNVAGVAIIAKIHIIRRRTSKYRTLPVTR